MGESEGEGEGGGGYGGGGCVTKSAPPSWGSPGHPVHHTTATIKNIVIISCMCVWLFDGARLSCVSAFEGCSIRQLVRRLGGGCRRCVGDD